MLELDLIKILKDEWCYEGCDPRFGNSKRILARMNFLNTWLAFYRGFLRIDLVQELT